MKSIFTFTLLLFYIYFIYFYLELVLFSPSSPLSPQMGCATNRSQTNNAALVPVSVPLPWQHWQTSCNVCYVNLTPQPPAAEDGKKVHSSTALMSQGPGTDR